MERWFAVSAACALWLGMGATTAAEAAEASAPPPCLTEHEADALVLVVLPDMLQSVGKACATALPPQDSTLRAGLPALVGRYRVEGDAAWPTVKPVIVKLSGEQMKGIDPDLLRPLVSAFIAPMIAKDIKPGDCPRYDRAATLLAPLPPSNLAGLVVELYRVGTKDKPNPPFTICPIAR